MNQNHHFSSPDCAAFAPLLPLAEQQLLSQPEDARLRAHVAACAHCQAELRVYTAAEEALRRSFAPGQGASPPFSREELMEIIDHQTNQPKDHPTPSAPPIIPATPPRRPRRFPAGLPALAAVLVIVVLIGTVFGITRFLPGKPGTTNRLVDLNKTALLSISMASATEGWAVGTTNADPAQGVILHYHLGRWWQVANPYDTGELRSVFMLSASDGWIVGDKGTILHYTRGRWVKVSSPVHTALGSVYMTTPDEGWAMGQDILHYHNGVWSLVNGPKHGFIFNIEDSSITGGWAVGGGGTVLQYRNGQWQVVPAPKIDLYSVGMIASNVGWAVGSGGSSGNLLHYQDGTWSVGDNPAPQETLWSIAVPSPEEAWAVGNTHSDTGLILHYSQGRWTEVASPTREFLLAVTLISPAEGWAVGSHGTILHYLNGTWNVYTSPILPESTQTPSTALDLAHYSLNSISMVSPDEGWAVGSTSTAYTTSDPFSGDSTSYVQPIMLHYTHGRWTEQPLPDFKHSAACTSLASPAICANVALYSVSMVSAQEGWAAGSTVPPTNVTDVGSVAVLLHYSGGKWTLENIQARRLSNLSMRSANDGWAIGQEIGFDGGGASGIWHYDGQSWAPITDPIFSALFPYHLTGTASGDLWVSAVDFSVSVGNGFDGNNPTVLLHYDGTHWSKIDPHIANGQLYGFAFGSPDEGWAVGTLPDTDQQQAHSGDALIMRYHNGVWQAYTHFPGPFGETYYSLSDVAMTSPAEGWAVGQDGVMMHYRNGAWERVPGPTGENLFAVTFVSASEGWAIGAHGVILHYQQGAWSVYHG